MSKETSQEASQKNSQYNLDDLLYLMERLRKPITGCPWDLKQDYRSIAPSTLEEAYEVVDAIEKSDYTHLKEELGDLLFQVIFYAQLAAEKSAIIFPIFYIRLRINLFAGIRMFFLKRPCTVNV